MAKQPRLYPFPYEQYYFTASEYQGRDRLDQLDDPLGIDTVSYFVKIYSSNTDGFYWNKLNDVQFWPYVSEGSGFILGQDSIITVMSPDLWLPGGYIFQPNASNYGYDPNAVFPLYAGKLLTFPNVASVGSIRIPAYISASASIGFESWFDDNPDKAVSPYSYSGYPMYLSVGQGINFGEEIRFCTPAALTYYVSGIVKKEADVTALSVSDIVFGVFYTGDVSSGVGRFCVNGEVVFTFSGPVRWIDFSASAYPHGVHLEEAKQALGGLPQGFKPVTIQYQEVGQPDDFCNDYITVFEDYSTVYGVDTYYTKLVSYATLQDVYNLFPDNRVWYYLEPSKISTNPVWQGYSFEYFWVNKQLCREIVR